jgi:hypothetical protein
METLFMQTSRTLSADWTQVLARVEAALAQAVARLQDRGKDLAGAAQLIQPPRPLNFGKFEERLAAFAACPAQAEQRLVQIDAALRDEEDALRRWLTRAEAARRRLANCVGSSG